MSLQVIRGDARHLPLEDDTVDLVVTSPPYFALRSYQDGGEHYAGQVGAEATPAEFVDALIEVTRECVRVLKPSGSMWVNLGDKYDSGTSTGRKNGGDRMGDGRERAAWNTDKGGPERFTMGRPKSLIGIPWRYALRCIDDLGLILRAEVIWSKPNGLPESVTDRVRRSHEQWFHFTLNPRYFSAVDEIREPSDPANAAHSARYNEAAKTYGKTNEARGDKGAGLFIHNPLGKLPGSVWTVPTEPLRVPEHLGVDHFAAFPTEWPKRIIQGWSPSGVCVGCGEGRRPVVERGPSFLSAHPMPHSNGRKQRAKGQKHQDWRDAHPDTIAGYTCSCPCTCDPTPWRRDDPPKQPDEDCPVHGRPEYRPDTTPAVVLDPFGGTGTTAHVAHALGRHGISVDLSADYCRLAAAPELADARLRKVLGIEKPPPVMSGQGDLFGGDAA